MKGFKVLSCLIQKLILSPNSWEDSLYGDFFYWLAHFYLLRNPPKRGARRYAIGLLADPKPSVRTFFGDWFVEKVDTLHTYIQADLLRIMELEEFL
jgi:hypothetical protein